MFVLRATINLGWWVNLVWIKSMSSSVKKKGGDLERQDEKIGHLCLILNRGRTCLCRVPVSFQSSLLFVKECRVEVGRLTAACPLLLQIVKNRPLVKVNKSVSILVANKFSSKIKSYP